MLRFIRPMRLDVAVVHQPVPHWALRNAGPVSASLSGSVTSDTVAAPGRFADMLERKVTMRHPALILPLLLACAAALPAAAQIEAAPAGEPVSVDRLTLQLNKLEPAENGCRASFVLRNPTEATYDSLKLDLVSFDPQGVIGQRLLVDLAPVPPNKTLVKEFDFEGNDCPGLARILINEVVACRTGTGEVDPLACLGRLDLDALTAELWK